MFIQREVVNVAFLFMIGMYCILVPYVVRRTLYYTVEYRIANPFVPYKYDESNGLLA